MDDRVRLLDLVFVISVCSDYLLLLLDRNRSRNVMRAARHYEGATHVLIRNAVITASQFVKTTAIAPPPLGKWVIAESPVRIDLAGGWSDTPPIT